MQIAILNRSNKLTDDDAMIAVQACSMQLAQHAAPLWSMDSCPVVFYHRTAPLPSDAHIITIFDSATEEGALGFHTESGDQIWGRVFVDPVIESGGVMLYDEKNPQNVSVASVLSHEVLEMWGDPYVNLWAQGPELSEGSLYSMELADPVEGDSYLIEINERNNQIAKVSVSNFITPRWFDIQCTAPNGYDYLNKLKKPFTMTKNGYMVVSNGPGSEQQVYAEHHPQWRKDMKNDPLSRTMRRKHPGKTPKQIAHAMTQSQNQPKDEPKNQS